MLADDSSVPKAAPLSLNRSVANSHGMTRNKTTMNMYQHQLQKQQQTLVQSRTMHSAGVTSMTSTTSSSSLSSFPIQSERMPKIKHWQDELMEFSTQLTRQAHFTLAKIASHFRSNGTKFDTNFRNHFLYIANNRWVRAILFKISKIWINQFVYKFPFLQNSRIVRFIFDWFAIRYEKRWLPNPTAKCQPIHPTSTD